MTRCLPAFSALAALLLAVPAHADSFWIGGYQHDVRISQSKFETGQDLKVGWIGERQNALQSIGRPAPHILVSKNLEGLTDYVAAGLNWRFGSTLYVRPGIGLALQNGPSRAYRKGWRVDLGSPVLFEPELAVGWQINRRLALEASWIHLSHATIFSRQNRGLDSMGLRLLVTVD